MRHGTVTCCVFIPVISPSKNVYKTPIRMIAGEERKVGAMEQRVL